MINMRDTRKDSEYFGRYISYESSRIQKWKAKLNGEIELPKKKKIALFLMNSQMNDLIASFSYGKAADSLAEKLCELVSTTGLVDILPYEVQLRLLSFSIMLNRVDISAKIDSRKLCLHDKLINSLWTYISSGTVCWKGELLFTSFNRLDDVFLEKNEKAMLNYLDGWYANNASSSWYNSHMSDSEIYNGYWSFESAAISKMLSLNESILEENPYYPVV